MKIALINMPWWVRYCPPYILAYFAALLRSSGHEVRCYDLNNTMYHETSAGNRKYWDNRDYYSSWENQSFVDTVLTDEVMERCAEEIEGRGTQAAIFATHTPSVLAGYKLARRLKEKSGDIVNIFLGHKASKAQMGYDFAGQPFIDYVCPGEADLPLKSLLNKLSGRSPSGELPQEKGFLMKRDGTVIDCGPAEYVTDLDTLPFPDYSDFMADIAQQRYAEPHRLDILDSRGCVNACHFCYERLFWPKYRTMSGKRIFEQISFHTSQFPQIDYFYFNGLLLNGDLRVLDDFCGRVIESGLKIRWAGQALVREDMSREMLNKMAKAGCSWLGYGIESGSQRVLDLMNKRFNIDKAVEVLKNTREAGIDFQINVMFGFPGETREDFEKTLDFLVRARPYIGSVLASQSFFTLEKKTYLRENPEKFGITGADHHLFWKADSGKNDYAERFRRYEEFCGLAVKLGIPETSGVFRVKPDKWFLLGQYYSHEKDFGKAAECFRRSIELESDNLTVRELLADCERRSAKNE